MDIQILWFDLNPSSRSRRRRQGREGKDRAKEGKTKRVGWKDRREEIEGDAEEDGSRKRRIEGRKKE